MIELVEKNPSLFPIVFIGMWALISILLAFFGGWHRLGKRYRIQSRFEGKKWYFQSLFLNFVSYGSCVTLGANRSAMYMAVLLPFRLGHPSISIPWTHVIGKESKSLMFRRVDIAFNNVSGVKLRLSKKQADRLEKTSREAWSYERI